MQCWYENRGHTGIPTAEELADLENIELRNSVFGHIRMMADWVAVTADILLSMNWTFLLAPEGIWFVTSDNPVCVWRPETTGWDLGLGYKDSQLFMPITPSVCFYALWTKVASPFTPVTVEKVAAINGLISLNSYRMIISPKPDFVGSDFVTSELDR